MLHRRRILLIAGSVGVAAPSLAASRRGRAQNAGAQNAGFESFLEGVRADARRAGVSAATIQRALSNIRPSDRVLELDRRQPEFTLTWAQYRDRALSQTRIDNGRRAMAENRTLLTAIAARYRVAPQVAVSIWAVETNFGQNTGGFNVIEALATLAWDGRRAEYFRRELIAALKILDAGHIAPERMRGSWAGAMGQPQFMPSNFDRLAVDFDGDGRRDIWDSRADALGSIANYLARSGWREGEPWAREVRLPPGLGTDDGRRPIREWARLGVVQANGLPLSAEDPDAAILQPDGSGGQAFATFANFAAVKRYNPSNYYALLIGLLADRLA